MAESDSQSSHVAGRGPIPQCCRTRLRLTQDTPDIAAALAQGQIVGLHHSLDRLEPALAGAPEPWDWDRLPVIEAEYRDLLSDPPPSPRREVVDRYLDGFRDGFEALIDGPAGASLPQAHGRVHC
jgi:hypothetical protein